MKLPSAVFAETGKSLYSRSVLIQYPASLVHIMAVMSINTVACLGIVVILMVHSYSKNTRQADYDHPEKSWGSR
jgi:hypothetical protein